ncbi:hypothetical protein [Geobacter pickeringii]|uniref:Uncharacterized protein n=1 Tax=Geobacter pickeringii TaxID=345632 RepID=A0A0B5BHD0_9BACT|nr:hypothetical protein [Geobacter pickeringii]AJE03436.1 hypothetical protein GPICK_08780 [Geobacter pickeringii]
MKGFRGIVRPDDKPPFLGRFPAIIYQGATGGVLMKSVFSKEIEAAMEVDRTSKSRKFPRIKAIALAIRKDVHFDALSREDWLLLADFLDGKHRGDRGHTTGEAQQREDDIGRVELLRSFIDRGVEETEAFERLAERERIDISSARKAVKRGLVYMAEDVDALRKEAERIERWCKMMEEDEEKNYTPLTALIKSRPPGTIGKEE